MTREEKAIMYFKNMRKKFCEDYLLGIPKDSVAYKATMAEKEFYDTAIEALEQEPTDENLHREREQAYMQGYEDASKRFRHMPSVAIPSAEPQTEQFAKWVATEIFDDMWEYNKDSFAEIACRKLEKLGIVRAKGDEWELVEPQEGE